MTSTAISSESLQYCDPTIGEYGYIPSLAAGVIFAVLYGLFTAFFLYLTIRRRLWFLSILLGAFTETLGWIARCVANAYPCSASMFTMQITCTILAPAFFSAALYIILGILILRTPELSHYLSPKMYLVIFCIADFFSLLLQGVGGGVAASADTLTQLNDGTYTMVGGIFLQLAAMTVFSGLFAHYLYSAYSATPRVKPDGRVVGVMVFATVLIMLRNIYRAIELLQGWNGYINTHQRFIIGLDAVPMILTLCSFVYLVIVDYGSDGNLLSRKRERNGLMGSEQGNDELKGEVSPVGVTEERKL